MPLKINLIHEQQEILAIQAKDPLKFVIMGTVSVLVLLAAYTGYVYMKYSGVVSVNTQAVNKWNTVEKKYKELLEQEKSQNALQAKADSLDRTVNKKVLIANFLDDLRTFIRPEMKLSSMTLSRTGENEINVKYNATWVGESAQENVGKYYNELEGGKIKIKGYEMAPGSLNPLTLANTDNATRVSFSIAFRLKANLEERK
ncbi:MAG: hypothetical protein SFY92_08250 [Verrucomicrobiae bacterium]|nr:hypothetical protein [Verrucomicrobiae bacterium]